MDRSSLLSSLSSLSSSASHTNFKTQFNLSFQPLSFHYSSSSAFIPQFLYKSNNSLPKNSTAAVSPRPSLRSSAFALEEALVKTNDSSSKIYGREMLPKIDKSGRFCSPRAARELALSIIYAACLEGSDPVRLFEKRTNARRELVYDFDKEKLLEYNHMSFGGPPVTVESIEEADELLQKNEKESAIEAEVLAAPPRLVYSKLILRFARKLLVAVMDKWDSHVLAINKVIPENWKSKFKEICVYKQTNKSGKYKWVKNEPSGRILELSILHLAISEIAVLGTRHQIVINEAVDLAKRFCDGAAPRIINGCLRTFVKDLDQTRLAETSHSRNDPLI